MEDSEFDDDRRVDVHSDDVPAGIRRAVLDIMQPGDTLWRCPRRSGPRGLLGLAGTGQRDAVVIEWWLLDEQGELVEAFFLDD